MRHRPPPPMAMAALQPSGMASARRRPSCAEAATS
jgi:hypothetical protein